MLDFNSIFGNRGLMDVIRRELIKNAPDVWATATKGMIADTNRVAQGALSSGKGVNVAGENTRRRRGLFGFRGFNLSNFDPTRTEDLLGLLLGMLLTRRW